MLASVLRVALIFVFVTALVVEHLAWALGGNTTTASLMLDAPLYPKDDQKKAWPEGWAYRFKGSLGGSFSEQNKVIGAPDGITNVYNLAINYQRMYSKDTYEWYSTIDMNAAANRNPPADTTVKTDDRLRMMTRATDRFDDVTWLGTYLLADLETNTFATFQPQRQTHSFAITDRDGTTRQSSHRSFQLNGVLSPLSLKESFGLSSLLFDTKAIRMEALGGLGARQTFAFSSYVIEDDPSTAELLEIRQLRDNHQFGSELVLEAHGSLFEKKLEYRGSYEIFIPAYYYIQDQQLDKSLLELNSAEIRAEVSYKLSEGLSANYTGRMLRQPLLTESWQSTHSVFVSLDLKLESESLIKHQQSSKE